MSASAHHHHQQVRQRTPAAPPAPPSTRRWSTRELVALIAAIWGLALLLFLVLTAVP